MLSRRAAARLLADARDVRALGAIADALGVGNDAAPLDAPARSALGLPAALRRVRVARGPGALRALVAEVPAGAALRDVVARTAARLAARTPQLLWIVLLAARDADDDGDAVAIAAWRASAGAPRVQALVVDRRRVADSDAETLAALAALGAATSDAGGDLAMQARWCEVLGRDALTRRFFRELERLVALLAADVAPRVGRTEARELALLATSRLLFLSFLQAKGWLDGDRDWLARRFDACMASGGGFHRRVLLPLWFGTLNTPRARRAPAARALGAIPFLNGGLFARTPVERRAGDVLFSDAALGQLFDDLLARYRFTAREGAVAWSEAAVDPEMLGRAFESLMHAGARRASGAFYTPQPIVEAATTEALARALARPGDAAELALVRQALAGEPLAGVEAAALRERAARLRVVDPACGSGAFLVHGLERLAALRARLGDARPVSVVRREVLARSIFGVDVHPTAVWLCELRLWLSVVIDDETADPARVPPLPNLDHHVRVGDALAGDGFGEGALPRPRARRLTTLRARYARAVGARKQSLARLLDREERRCAVAALERRLATLAAARREMLVAARTPDLFGERHHPDRARGARILALRAESRALRAGRRAIVAGGALPFDFAAHFADVGADGGFDVVLGNPPWVRPHRLAPAARDELRRRFRTLRHAAWLAGAADAGADRGFAGQADLAAPFTERALALLAPGGVLAFLLPAKLWCALAGGGVRAHLAEHAEVLAVEDWRDAPAAFDAAVYPSLLVARKHGQRREPAPDVAAARHRRDAALRWNVPPGALPLAEDAASPWLVVPAEVRAAFDRLARAGVPLVRHPAGGRPLLGVKSGCNDAFVVELLDDRPADGVALVRAGTRTGLVERALLRPALRGRALAPWRAATDALRLVWTHDAADRPLAALPPHARDWLAPLRPRLLARSDGRGGRLAWWTLFRTEGARADRPRLVWADIGRAPRAAVLHAGDDAVPLNSCYTLPCADVGDARALAALLASPLAAAWLALLAEPARGGYHRYLGWTMARLPLPADWPRARALLAPLAERAERGERPTPHALLDAALEAYGVRRADVAPLLLWTDA